MGLAYFLSSFIHLAFEIYFWLIIARVIFSWIPVPHNRFFRQIYEFVYEVTEPFLRLIRKFVPVIGAGGIGIDLSPWIAIILLQIVERALINLIYLVF